jgi:hypothetical protein
MSDLQSGHSPTVKVNSENLSVFGSSKSLANATRVKANVSVDRTTLLMNRHHNRTRSFKLGRSFTLAKLPKINLVRETKADDVVVA